MCGYKNLSLHMSSNVVLLPLKICEYCGKEFKVIPSRFDKRRFCSKKCAGKWLSKCKVRPKKTCKYCGKKFYVQPSRLDERQFCSRVCYGKWRSENIPKCKVRLDKTCKYCGKKFEVLPSGHKRQFCSQKCAGKWLSENIRGENHSCYKPKIKKVCERCGKIFEVNRSVADMRRHCSRKCKGELHSEIMHGEKNPAWNGGTSFEPYCHKFNEAFRESIREKFGRTCFLCPTTEQEQLDRMRSQSKRAYKLAIHHVNYNKDCLCDDSECEFVPLCSSCHTKTNFNRKYWENLIMEKLKEKNSNQ